MKIHIVQPGETLESLSARYGVSVAKLRELNPQLTQEGGLTPGTKVKMPTGRVKVNTTKAVANGKESSVQRHQPFGRNPRRPFVPRIPTPIHPPVYPPHIHPGIPPLPYPQGIFYPPMFPYTPDYQTYYSPMHPPYWNPWMSQSPGTTPSGEPSSMSPRTQAVGESPTHPDFEWESALQPMESSSAEY